jgi:microcystin-dependent protein
MADPVATNPDADGLVGQIIIYGGETLPSPKYRWCHGAQTLSRTEFSLCFSRLGELWGAGDGSTTFNLPNFDMRVPAGIDSTGVNTAFDRVGDTGGSAAATMPPHDHDISPNPHGHTYVNPFVNVVSLQGGATPISFPDGTTTSTGTTSLTTSTEGSGDNWPPYAAVRYIIKVS